MLKVYGRQLPNLKVTCPTEKHLYIDIDGKDLGQFSSLNLPPVDAYIITTKDLDEFDLLITQGYYNILHVDKASEITEKLIGKFISQDYNENHLKLVSKRVADMYKTGGTVVQSLVTALEALRDDDSATFSRIMSTDLFKILDEIETINKMAGFSKSLQQSEETFTEAVQKAAKLEDALKEAERFRKLYEGVKSNNLLESAEVEDLRAQVEDLNTRINSHVVTAEEVHNSAEYRTVEARLETITAERNEIKRELEELRQEYDETTSIKGGSALAELNKQLREELRKLKERKISDAVADKLPIFTDATMLKASSIICFKEVRPTVYINSLIEWLNASLRLYSRAKNKSYLILVVDPLSDAYSESKYLKHGWNINKMTDKMSVLVIPPLRFDTLKSTYHIDSYDVIICIDRCHVNTSVFDIKRAITYYLVNTCNDISDFGLDGTKCIAFMDKVPAGTKSADLVPKYHIPTWSEVLTTNDFKQRTAKHAEDGVFASILKEGGIWWG